MVTARLFRALLARRLFFCSITLVFPIRAFPATFTVLNTSDTGAGSLRQAIIDANDAPGPDIISFRIPGAKPYTITPLSTLPSITEAVTIDGTTQTNYSGQPIIQLNGTSAGSNANGLLILGGNSLVRGLVINRFQRSGIRIEGAGTNVIEGNYLGTDVNGTNYAGNGLGGVYIYESAGNLIGKSVQGLDDTNATVTGMVNSVKVEGNDVFLELDNGNKLALSRVTSIAGTKAPGQTVGTNPVTGAAQ